VTKSGSAGGDLQQPAEQNKAARLGEEAARPHRVTYRKLTRWPARARGNIAS